MEDFTKLDKQTTQEVQLLLANKVAESDFRGTLFDSFANKDNFWNLLFALGVVLGSLTIGFVFSFIIMLFVLKRFNKVTFSDGKVFSSQNKELSIQKQTPSAVFVIITTVASTLFISMNFTSYLNSLPDTLSAAIITSCFVFIPTLFFILKNCPISLLFCASFWKENNKNTSSPDFNHNSSERNAFSSPSQLDYQTQLRYSDRPENTHFKRHWYY